MPGYIKLHRELIKKPIWLNSSPEQKSILIAILLSVNFVEKDWEWKGEKYSVLPGQMITSLDSIKKKCGKGISIQNIRTSLKRFGKLGFLTDETTKTGRLIIVVNWGSYQIKEKDTNKDTNKDLTDDQQRPNKDLTPKKKVKKVKKVKKKDKEIPQKLADDDFYLTKKKRKLSGKRLESFELFWSFFNYKKDKRSAADSWFDIPKLTNTLVESIYKSARVEAANRQSIKDKGMTPIYAQGWLTAMRWEDEADQSTGTNISKEEMLIKFRDYSEVRLKQLAEVGNTIAFEVLRERGIAIS
jgi:hypothetical protein